MYVELIEKRYSKVTVGRFYAYTMLKIISTLSTNGSLSVLYSCL